MSDTELVFLNLFVTNRAALYHLQFVDVLFQSVIVTLTYSCVVVRPVINV